MDKLKILGGLPLVGEVQAAGAKNAALPILCASLLTADPLELSNVPQLQDIATTIRLLKLLGVKTERDEERLTLQADSLVSTEAPYELVKTMRASILVLGPLLARFGEARVSLPGGCVAWPAGVASVSVAGSPSATSGRVFSASFFSAS